MSETNELNKRFMGHAKRELFRQFRKPPPAAILFAREAGGVGVSPDASHGAGESGSMRLIVPGVFMVERLVD